MSVLLDTNILARLVQTNSPQHSLARSAVELLQSRNENLCIVPQVLYELWVICTRPVGSPHNGLGLTINQAKSELSRAQSLFRFLPDTPGIFIEWERLVLAHQTSGKNAHDARIVAAMSAHSLTKLLTFNVADFSRYSDIEVINPAHLPAT